jgi:hypothetical protein
MKYMKKKYYNEGIEKELITFKQEIELKFAKSDVNQKFRFPRMKEVSVD